jgi:hypothetical protein
VCGRLRHSFPILEGNRKEHCRSTILEPGPPSGPLVPSKLKQNFPIRWDVEQHGTRHDLNLVIDQCDAMRNCRSRDGEWRDMGDQLVREWEESNASGATPEIARCAAPRQVRCGVSVHRAPSMELKPGVLFINRPEKICFRCGGCSLRLRSQIKIASGYPQ